MTFKYVVNYAKTTLFYYRHFVERLSHEAADGLHVVFIEGHEHGADDLHHHDHLDFQKYSENSDIYLQNALFLNHFG